MSALDPLTPIPLVILTGFLGSGKTSWLNGALKHPDLSETLVIINEFGEAGLDHLLIEKAPGEMVLMAAGCLCCSLRSDLVSTLEDLLRRRDNKRMPMFPRVVIETTGLADPLPILQSVLQHPYLAKRFEISGIITFIDSQSGAATLASHESARKQVAMADALVLTKRDIASPEATQASRQAVAAINPRIAPVDVTQFPPEALFLPRFEPHHAEAVEHWLGEGQTTAAHGTGIESFTFFTDAPITQSALVVFQEAMRILHGPRLLRLKGLVRIKDHDDTPVVIHHVQSIAHPPITLPRWPSRDRRTRLVFVTQGIPRAVIEGFWAALTKAA